jgi:hypothetical protein
VVTKIDAVESNSKKINTVVTALVFVNISFSPLPALSSRFSFKPCRYIAGNCNNVKSELSGSLINEQRMYVFKNGHILFFCVESVNYIPFFSNKDSKSLDMSDPQTCANAKTVFPALKNPL